MNADVSSKPKMVSKSNLCVMMLGFRGPSNVQGGTEKHVQHLSSHLNELGCQINVIVRSPYQPDGIDSEWKGVRFKRIWAPVSKSFEVIMHTFLGVCYAAVKRPDVLHIHDIAPSLLVPLARIFGLKVVVTHHGPDYDREKFGYFAKFILKLAERLGMTWAHERIVISQVIRNLVKNKYGKESVLIPNGVELPELPETTETLIKFGLIPEKYFLIVSRLVPEKRHLDLIRAFVKADLPDWKLAIVGNSEPSDNYIKDVLATIRENPSLIPTGFQSGRSLQELYANAGVFVLPSSHEGLPIALLEALSYGLPVIASDIPAHFEIGLPTQHYFRLGDIDMLSQRLREFASITQSEKVRNDLRNLVSKKYNWDEIALCTLQVYLHTLDNTA